MATEIDLLTWRIVGKLLPYSHNTLSCIVAHCVGESCGEIHCYIPKFVY